MLWCGQAPPLAKRALKAEAMPAMRPHWVKPPLMQALGCTTSTACATSRSRKRVASPSFWPAARGMEVLARSFCRLGMSLCVTGSSKKLMSKGSTCRASLSAWK
ncbi:hypothetical protein D9M68_995740 [compost metagenome]